MRVHNPAKRDPIGDLLQDILPFYMDENDFKSYVRYIEDFYERPEFHDIDITSDAYEAIEYANNNIIDGWKKYQKSYNIATDKKGNIVQGGVVYPLKR